jgi:hypothetical protein
MMRSLMLVLSFGLLWLPNLAEAKSQAPHPTDPERNPKLGSTSTPKRLHPSEITTRPWTDVEVAAKAKCTATLSGVRLDFEPLPPIQRGQCGIAKMTDATKKKEATTALDMSKAAMKKG